MCPIHFEIVIGKFQPCGNPQLDDRSWKLTDVFYLANGNLSIFGGIVFLITYTNKLGYKIGPKTVTKRPCSKYYMLSAHCCRGGSLHCMWAVQTHSGTPLFFAPFRKDLARLNGAPQPNQKWLPSLGIQPWSLNHKPQPFLPPSEKSCMFMCITGNKISKTTLSTTDRRVSCCSTAECLRESSELFLQQRTKHQAVLRWVNIIMRLLAKHCLW